ncbi:MAG: SRPBCC domain-containing protein [Methyloceanibacter sp.]
MRAESDARVGGRFRFAMRGNDGEEHDVNGIYREVVPNEKLVFTWAWRSTPERESLDSFYQACAGSQLTLTHEQFFDEAARDRHAHGWTGCLNKLERYFA